MAVCAARGSKPIEQERLCMKRINRLDVGQLADETLEVWTTGSRTDDTEVVKLSRDLNLVCLSKLFTFQAR